MTNKKNPTIGIIGGTGKMGQWFVNFFQTQKITVIISGRNTKIKNAELVKKSDIIIISVPISEIQKVIKETIPFIKKNSLLTDLTSFKIMPTDAMKESKSETLGMHPLFGPSATIDQGLKIVFSKQKNHKHTRFLKELFTKTGIEIIDTSPEEHDYQMAYVQAFTHALNLLFAKIIFEDKNVLDNKLHTPIFTLQLLTMGRVLHQDLKLLSDIQLYNPYFLPIIKSFVEQGERLEKIIEKNSDVEFIKMFKEEKELSRNFASFSTLQTDKILQHANEVKINIPTKIEVTNLPKNPRIAFLGPKGTFSNQAAITLFPKEDQKKIPYETLFDIFEAVQNNDVSIGIAPAENSIEGTVRETLDYLIDFSLYVLGSYDLPIHQQLLTNEKSFGAIINVVSHPQALAQCKKWLKTNLPDAKLVSTASTTSALKNIKKGHAYIGSEMAAEKYKINILEKNIEDNSSNTTRFYIISKKKMPLTGLSNKKILLFLTVQNRVGILRDILNVFAEYNINLTKLESRPSGHSTWDYHFFVEFEKPKEELLSKTLKELSRYCPIIRILGKT